MCPSIVFLLQTFGRTSNMLISLPNSFIKSRPLFKLALWFRFLRSCWSCGLVTWMEGIQVSGMFLQWGANMDSYYCQGSEPGLRNWQRDRDRETEGERGGKNTSSYLTIGIHFLALGTCFLYVSGTSQVHPLCCSQWWILLGLAPTKPVWERECPSLQQRHRDFCCLPLSVYFLASNQPPSLDHFPSFCLGKFLPF